MTLNAFRATDHDCRECVLLTPHDSKDEAAESGEWIASAHLIDVREAP